MQVEHLHMIIIKRILFKRQFVSCICTDIDECVLLNGGCAHNCINLNGGHECACRDGFTLEADNRNCLG